MDLEIGQLEIFNNYGRNVIVTPLNIEICDEEKLKKDYENVTGINVDDEPEHRNILARLFWFLTIYKSNENDYPNVNRLLGKLTSETVVARNCSSDTVDYEFEIEKEKNVSDPYEWYDHARNTLLLQHVSLPKNIDDIIEKLNIHDQLTRLEKALPTEIVYDEYIKFTLRGLYNTLETYLGMGVLIPTTKTYMELSKLYIDVDTLSDLSCYIQFSKHVFNTYIKNYQYIKTHAHAYKVFFLVSIPYQDVMDYANTKLFKISFRTDEPFQSYKSLEKESFHVSKVVVRPLVHGGNFTIDDVMDNYDKNPYEIEIKTTDMEKVLNYLKIKDILPHDVYLYSYDLLNDEFFSILERLGKNRV